MNLQVKEKGDLSCPTAPQSGKKKGSWYLHHAVHPRAVNHMHFERRGVYELSTLFLGVKSVLIRRKELNKCPSKLRTKVLAAWRTYPLQSLVHTFTGHTCNPWHVGGNPNSYCVLFKWRTIWQFMT